MHHWSPAGLQQDGRRTAVRETGVAERVGPSRVAQRPEPVAK
ncbi:hypothetical protein [Pseudarthrobacter quantipunctorum]|uniref:Uncharacterized protein n=1 Tax=Pseudarthrobacter quantipunctorum TaxID=3128980 RepID=A0ABZ2R288_9MICC